MKHVPGVCKAVRWHGPFHGVEGQGWFLAFGGFQHHVKFSVFKGTSFKPVPPIGQFKNVRSLDVRESDKLDEKQLATWIKQAASIPGVGRPAPRLELAAVQIFSTTSRER